MQLTPRHSPQICTHERGVGTTVCLHCRKEARVAAKDRRQRLMLRGAAGAIVLATGLGATALGAAALRDRTSGKRTSATAAKTAPEPTTPATDSAHASADSTSRVSAPAPGVVPVAVAKPTVAKSSAPVPIIQMGASSVAGGFNAERTDTAVTLSFDQPMTRTRRAEKFEQFVRATLPSIYGKKIDSALTTMPAGALAKQGDLITELPTRGMRIPVDSAWEIRVFPETRKGVEGPLVVRYRALAVAR